MAKFNVRQLAEDYGITVDTVKIGENADWASPFHDLTPKQFDQVGGAAILRGDGLMLTV